MRRSVHPLVVVVLLAAACGSSPAAGPGQTIDAMAALDAGPADATVIPPGPKAAPCASTFGSALTPAFGRLDGTVLAVIPPNDQACPAPNMTHMIIEVTMGGAAYRMVVDVLSNQGSPDVLLGELDAPLVAGAWADGWHPGVALDYVAQLGVHSPAFTAMHQADLVAKITSELDLNAHVSVFATAGATEPDSAHLVHREGGNHDGAIVIHPDGAQPHYLLMRFDEQLF